MIPYPKQQTKPRRTLNSLLREAETATRERRQVIKKHWPRSVRAMLAAFLAEHPDEPVRPMPSERVTEKFKWELLVWWDEPFGPDGVPIVFDLLPGMKNRAPEPDMIRMLVDMGVVDASKGYDLVTNHTLKVGLLNAISSIAWDTAWRERHLAGEGGGRPETPSVDGITIPNSHWQTEDYQHTIISEMRCIQYRTRNTAYFKAQGVPYHPRPMESMFHHPLMAKLITGEEAVPAPAPGQEPIPLPKGPNGRRMIREIYMDDLEDLGCTLREQTEAEAAEEDRQRGWRICSWYDPPRGPTHREYMRPILEAYGQLDMLDQFSDELIQYDPPG